MKVHQRFTNRVNDYIKYRPHYPPAVYTALRDANVIAGNSVIADIGCGTGISSELFLKNNHTVFGVDPNEEMLNAAKQYLSEYNNFHAIFAPAENTTLANQSVDTIVCAQAFHWFDQTKTRAEFKRIAKNNAQTILLWNDRRTDSSDFLKVYEDFLQMFGTDYKTVDHKRTQKPHIIKAFFGGTYNSFSIPNSQELDFAGLKGRVLSSSYMPDDSHADYDFMIYCLKKIFARYQHNGKVTIEYDTKVYHATIR